MSPPLSTGMPVHKIKSGSHRDHGRPEKANGKVSIFTTVAVARLVDRNVLSAITKPSVVECGLATRRTASFPPARVTVAKRPPQCEAIQCFLGHAHAPNLLDLVVIVCPFSKNSRIAGFLFFLSEPRCAPYHAPTSHPFSFIRPFLAYNLHPGLYFSRLSWLFNFAAI